MKHKSTLQDYFHTCSMSGQPIFNEDDNCFANTEVIMVILVILVILVELWRWERESGKA